jgi:hypothetical protein
MPEKPGSPEPSRDRIDLTGDRLVGGPVSKGWRECTLTRAKELESLCAWVLAGATQEQPASPKREDHQVLAKAILQHLEAARQAAEAVKLGPKRRVRVFRNGSLIERAASNLDAAEAQLLNLAPATYVLGQVPSLLNHVQCHLTPADPRRIEFERIARTLGVKDADHLSLPKDQEQELENKIKTVNAERGKIATAFRAASSAALREQVRIRSFRLVLIVTTAFMALLATMVAIIGLLAPTLIPMCFAPEEAGQTMVVCPTAQSEKFSTPSPGVQSPDIDDYIRRTATPQDLLVVELIGLTAAAVAAAAALRRIRGSSERHGLPVALAVLKLPTGAVTAFLGLLLMRGQFVPGLAALDTSAQILAWALIFGYAQQLFTRLVDQQGQAVLNSVRSADKTTTTPLPS